MGGWGRIAVAGALLLLSGIAANAQGPVNPECPGAPECGPAVEEAAAEGTGKQNPEAEPPVAPAVAVPGEQDGGASSPGDQREEQAYPGENDRAVRDLAAQEWMARSAAKMVDPLEWPVLMAMIGSVLIGITLILNGVSLAWSIKAVRQSRENVQIELRAYVNVSRVFLKIYETEHAPAIFVLFKNYGSTPACNMVHNGDMRVPKSGTENFSDPDEPERKIINISPGQEISLGRHFHEKTWPMMRGFMNLPTHNLYAWGRFSYADVFGERYNAEYRFWLPYKIEGPGDYDLIPCQEGNTPA